MRNKTRDGSGRYARTIQHAQLDAQAARLKVHGHTYQEIAEQLGLCDKTAAWRAVQRAIADTIAEPAAEVLALELQRLDQALLRLATVEAKVREVLHRDHITVSNGKVIYALGDDGTKRPLLDDAPILQAAAQLVSIENQRVRTQDRRAKYLGLDAAKRVEVITLDAIDAEIARLSAELGQFDGDHAAAAAGTAPAPPGQS